MHRRGQEGEGGVRGRKAREAEGASTPTSALLLQQQTLSARPLSLHSGPSTREATGQRGRGGGRAPTVTFIPCCFSSPLPPRPSSLIPSPGFGGDSPLVTETIASGRAALRLPRVFVSSSCEAPGPGAGSAAAAAEAGAQRCSARLPGRGRTLARRRRRRTPASHALPASRAPVAAH